MKSDTYQTRVSLLEKLHDRNDEGAWHEFVLNYRPYIHVVIYRMGVSSNDVDDLVQGVLMKLWDKLPDFIYDKTSRFRSYVATITKNHVLDYIRSRKAELQRYDKKKQELMHNDLLQIQVPEVDEIVEREWELFIANLALNNIRDSFKAEAIIVFEKLLNGEKAQEIADELGLKKNTVHQMGLRVKNKMIAEIIHLKTQME